MSKDKKRMNPEEGKLFLKKITRIDQSTESNTKNSQLYFFFNVLMEEWTNFEKLEFKTLFSRIAFAGIKYKIHPRILFHLHEYRRLNEAKKKLTEIQYLNGLKSIVLTVRSIYDLESDGFLPSLSVDDLPYSARKIAQFKRYIKGVMTSIDIHSSTFMYIAEDSGEVENKVFYNLSDKNEIFTSTINKIEKYFPLPVHVNLIDVEEDQQGNFIPSAIVIEPNYLIDVTAIAEIYKPGGSRSLLYLLKKFIPVTVSKGLLVGNISNYLLDELISNPTLDVKSKLLEIFKMHSLSFANRDDRFVQEVVKDIYKHARNLRATIVNDFPLYNLDLENLHLEPSFYDTVNGLQGRLDILNQNEDSNNADIVELKSGKIFRPNVYGLNNNHYTQTLLYDLIIQTVFDRRYKAANYILYSQDSEKTLRFAPAVRSQQIEALATRNQILLLEKSLEKVQERSDDILALIRPENFPKAAGFVKDNIKSFSDTYGRQDTLSKLYFNLQVSFIAREHHLAKVGRHGVNADNGLASLWLDNFEQKEQRFSILKNLKITENLSHEDSPQLLLAKTKSTNPLANFRVGDIGVLYPILDDIGDPLKNQVFKCTIVSLSEKEVMIRLRSKQTNQKLFKTNTFWNIEPDHLDSSFNGMYRGLYSFIGSDKKWKDLWLGKTPPRQSVSLELAHKESLTSEQNQVLKEMLSCKDYYLLWGPPGTGKTSRMLKHYVEEKYKNTDEVLLLLAYTNRAVDEICSAIESIGDDVKENYLRIGSRYASGESYRGNLLQNAIADIDTRKALKAFIQSKRIIVSTLSSIVGKAELFDLLNIETVVIDEASQILDPLLAGFLSRFKRFILIGDHKQLPAVVTQEPKFTKVNNTSLNDVGIEDLRSSSFERLYLLAQHKNWDWAYGALSFQGRMHPDLMAFPNDQFYRGNLKYLDTIDRMHDEWNYKFADSELSSLLATTRKVFISAEADDDLNVKTNIHEAYKVVKVIQEILEIYKLNNKKVQRNSIGVITPYRAQIAQIKKLMMETDLPTDDITVDTVERYQGGARDIIILSFCVNKTHQLKSLVSLSKEGVDRKLNVALTRAKEQIVLIGNKELLEENPVYKELIYTYHSI